MAEVPGVILGPGDRIAVVAGSGRLPVDAVEGLAAKGIRPIVIMLAGEVTEVAALSSYENLTMGIEDLGLVPDIVKKHRITHMTMTGGVSRRPKITQFRGSLGLLKMVPNMLRAFAGGDNKALSMIIAGLNALGVKVIGVHEIVPELLAPLGPMTKAKPGVADKRDLDAGWRAAKAIGALDIGQAAVAIGGRAVELEGIEGTAALLDRVRMIRSHGRLAGKTRGALVKCAKPDQELRVDLPAIGPDTIDSAHAAGLAGIGLETGRAIILERQETVARANRLGLFLVGMNSGPS